VSPRFRPVVVDPAARPIPVAPRMSLPLAFVQRKAFSLAFAPLRASPVAVAPSFCRQVTQLEGCEGAVLPGRRGNSPVEVASRHAPSRHNNLPGSPSLYAEPLGRRRATPSLPRRRRASPAGTLHRCRASSFAVPDRAPPHRRGAAGPSTLRRQETVAGTHRDATASTTMPVVAGVLHLASHAVVDPRELPSASPAAGAWAPAPTALAAVSAGATGSSPLPEGGTSIVTRSGVGGGRRALAMAAEPRGR